MFQDKLSIIVICVFLFFFLVVKDLKAQNGNIDTANWEQGLYLGFNGNTGNAFYYSNSAQDWLEIPGSGMPGFQVRFYSQKKLYKSWFWQWEFGLASFGRTIERNVERPVPLLYYIGMQGGLSFGKRILKDNIRWLAGITSFYSLTASGDRRFLYGLHSGFSVAIPGSGLILDTRCVLPSISDMLRADYLRYQPFLWVVSFTIPFGAGEYSETFPSE